MAGEEGGGWGQRGGERGKESERGAEKGIKANKGFNLKLHESNTCAGQREGRHLHGLAAGAVSWNPAGDAWLLILRCLSHDLFPSSWIGIMIILGTQVLHREVLGWLAYEPGGVGKDSVCYKWC